MGPNLSHLMPQLSINVVPSTGGPQPPVPNWGHCHQIQASARAVTATQRQRFQVFTPPLKGHKGDCAPVSHTVPSEHNRLMPTRGRSWLTPKGRSPEPGRGASTDRGWAAEGSAQGLGAEADFAAARRSTCPDSPVSPRRVQSPFPPTPRLWHRAPGARRAGPARSSDQTPSPDLPPGSASHNPCAHSPLWLTQVGFRSFIVRPPPPG